MPLVIPIRLEDSSEVLGQSYNSLTVASLGAGALGNQHYQTVFNSVEIFSGVGFTIVVEIIDSAIETLLASGGAKEINVQLLIDDVEVQVLSASYQEPTGKVGSFLNAKVSILDAINVPTDASVTFKLLYKTAGNVWKSRTYMDNGKLVGRDYTEQFSIVGPGDEISISAIDSLNDVIENSPSPYEGFIIYNPNKTTVALPTSHEENDYIVDIAGNALVPQLRPDYGLSVYTIMSIAYGALGLRVATNISNYPVAQVAFAISSSWHSVAAQFYAMFDPMIFSSGGDIYVIDPDQYLPTGWSGKLIGPDKHYLLGNVRPADKNQTSVLISYEDSSAALSGDPSNDGDPDPDGGSYMESEVTDSTFDESGDPFGLDYVASTNRVTYVEVTRSTEPDIVLSTYERYRTTQTVINVLDEESESLIRRTVSTEDMAFRYDGNLPIGYAKSVQGRLFSDLVGHEIEVRYVAADGTVGTRTDTVHGVSSLQLVTTEINSINWINDPLNADKLIQAYNETKTEGLIYTSGEGEIVTDPTTGSELEIFRKWPILVAQSSGIIDQSGTITWGPITTTIEQLIRIRKNQTKASVRVIDHLNGTIKSSFTSGKVQSKDSISHDDRRGSGKSSKTIFMTNGGTYKAPENIGVSGLNRTDAIQLGAKALSSFASRRFTQPVGFVDPDPSIRRGSILRLQNREGDITGAYVTGFGLACANLGKQGHRIELSVDTLKVRTR